MESEHDVVVVRADAATPVTVEGFLVRPAAGAIELR